MAAHAARSDTANGSRESIDQPKEREIGKRKWKSSKRRKETFQRAAVALARLVRLSFDKEDVITKANNN